MIIYWFLKLCYIAFSTDMFCLISEDTSNGEEEEVSMPGPGHAGRVTEYLGMAGSTIVPIWSHHSPHSPEGGTAHHSHLSPDHMGAVSSRCCYSIGTACVDMSSYSSIISTAMCSSGNIQTCDKDESGTCSTD